MRLLDAVIFPMVGILPQQYYTYLLRRYLAGRLSVLSFLTPMFGVLCGVVFLGEPLTGYFLVAVVLVAAGIVLVNLRR